MSEDQNRFFTHRRNQKKKQMSSLQTLSHSNKPCMYCNLTKVNEFKYGPLFERDGIVAHYYCVLFSNNLSQNGRDDEGIKGFLIQDIENELKNVKLKKCYYCHKGYASIQCSHKNCKISFHYPCGIVKGSMHQFKNHFKSYCLLHRPFQPIPEKVMAEAEARKPECVICYETVSCRSALDTIWAKCCGKTWYHRDCLQRHALSTGYFFKCAICGNNKEFKKLVLEYGIFVPNQDASWELEPNAFVGLYRRYGTCDAITCKCPNGREFDDERALADWQLVLCRSCGSQGMHVGCGLLSRHNPRWECKGCRKVGRMVRAKKGRNTGDSTEGECNDTEESASSNSQSGRFELAAGSRGESGKCVKKRKVDVDETENLYVKKKKKKRRTGEAADLDKDAPKRSEQETVSASDEDKTNVEASQEKSRINEGRTESTEEHTDRLAESNTTRCEDDDINSIVEVYRNIQMTDVRYRVKKKVYVVSDDYNSDSDDVEVVYEKTTPRPKEQYTVNVSVSVEVQDGEDLKMESRVGCWVDKVNTSKRRRGREDKLYTENITQMEAELTRLLWKRRKNAPKLTTNESTSSDGSSSSISSGEEVCEIVDVTSDNEPEAVPSSQEYFSADSTEIIDVE